MLKAFTGNLLNIRGGRSMTDQKRKTDCGAADLKTQVQYNADREKSKGDLKWQLQSIN